MADFTDEQYGLDPEDKDLIQSIGGGDSYSPDAGQLPETDALGAGDLLDDGNPAPVIEGPQLDPNQELPGGVLDQIAETPSPAPEEEQPVAATSEATIRKQGGLEQQQAQAGIDVATQQVEDAKQHNMDMRLAYADWLERRQRSEQDLDRKVKELDAAKVTDPRKQDVWKNRVAVIFGGLGAGLAGGSNAGLDAVQKKWHDDTERQKANIGLLQDRVAIARTGVKDADEARRQMVDASNAQLISNYNTAIKQGELQLKKLGIPAAEIAQDQRLQKLQAGKAAAVQLARKQNDDHELAQARIKLMAAQAARAGRVNAGGAGDKKAAAKDDKEVHDDIKSYETRTEGRTVNVRGKVGVVTGIQSLRKQLNDAMSSGDTGRMKAAAIAVQEKAGSLLSGGKTTNFQGHIIESPKTMQDQIQEGIGKFTNSPAAGKSYMKSLVDLLNTVEQSHLTEVDEARDMDVQRLLGAGGLGRTEKGKAAAMNLINTRYEGVKNADGSPRYQGEHTQAAPAPKPAGYSAKDVAGAKKVLADPGSYAPEDRAKAAKIMKAQLAPIVL